MSKILNIFLALFFTFLCLYLLFVDSLELPSRYGSHSSILFPPVTWLMAALPFSFTVSLILYFIDRDKYKSRCQLMVTIGVVLFFVGIVIIAPLLKMP